VVHGTTDQLIIQNWYTSPTINQIEDLQAGNGQHLLNTQVDQLIQAMASFSQQSGLSWDRAIDQRRSRCKRSWPPAGTEPYDMPELSRRSLSGQ